MVLYRVFLLRLKGARWRGSELTGLKQSSHASHSAWLPPALGFFSVSSLFFFFFFANPSSSLACLPASFKKKIFVFPQCWHSCRFLWEWRDLWWSESTDVFPSPRQPHNHRCWKAGKTKSPVIWICIIIQHTSAVSICGFIPTLQWRPALFLPSSEHCHVLVCPYVYARYMIVRRHWTRQWTTICNSLRASMLSMQTTSPSSKSCRANWMSWSDRWSRFLSGTTTSFPWKIYPPALNYTTGIGKTVLVHSTETYKEEINLIFLLLKFMRSETAMRSLWKLDLPFTSMFPYYWKLCRHELEWLCSPILIFHIWL